jgi:ABC-type sugar transport system permease subunit
VKFLFGLGLLLVAMLVGLYGVFAILYGGDSRGSGDTYVTIAGHEMDADLAGAIALLIAFFTVLFSTMLLRRQRRTQGNQ